MSDTPQEPDDGPLDLPRARPAAVRRPDCPAEEQFRMVAVGLLEPGDADPLLEHAAGCDWCERVLRESVQDLAVPLTEEEIVDSNLSRLAHVWKRRRLSSRLAQTWSGRPPWWRRPWVLAPAVLIPVAAALVMGIVYLRPNPAEEARRLLSRAYTSKRTIEMRLPGAAYGPMRVKLGPGTSDFERPPELLEAEVLIVRGIQAHPDDPKWLHLQGRADLLDNKEDDAISALDRAPALDPQNTDVLSDLGIAWYQKADKASDLKQYAQAFDYLSKAVQLKPADPALVFNRALAAEKIFAFNEARDAWEAYLRLDSRTEWANIAREHLDRVKKNLTYRKPTLPPPLPTR